MGNETDIYFTKTIDKIKSYLINKKNTTIIKWESENQNAKLLADHWIILSVIKLI